MQPPPIIASARPRRAWWIVCGAAALLLTAGFIFYRFNPARYGFYPRCALYAETGLYCPACGSQRALYYLMHGHLLTALRCNLLLILSLPVVAYFFARYFSRWMANQPLPLPALRPAHIKWLIVLVTVFTVLRNIPCAPFNFLAPP